MKKCQNCNFDNQDDSQFCGNCGTPLPMTVPQGNPQQPKNSSGGMSTASMVLGIVGLVLTFVVIGIVPAIIGLVLGIIALVGKQPKLGQAIAGVVLSGIAIILFALLMIGTSVEDNETDNSEIVSEQEETGNEEELSQSEWMEQQGEKDREVSSDDIEVVAEYTLPDSIGWYSRHFMIIKNNSDATVDVSTSSLAYSSDGTMVSSADASLEALGEGCTSVLYEAFETEAQIDHYDTTINVQESEYYDSVIQNLDYVQNDIDGGAVFQVTNNGDKTAEFVEGYALYFSGEQLVDYQTAYFTNDSSELNPGETISEQLTAYEDFDRMEFYLTGRASKW